MTRGPSDPVGVIVPVPVKNLSFRPATAPAGVIVPVLVVGLTTVALPPTGVSDPLPENANVVCPESWPRFDPTGLMVPVPVKLNFGTPPSRTTIPALRPDE